MPNRYFIGTSGWVYDHWRGPFYPPELPTSRWLDFFCKQFDTVELNSSFYRLPAESTWRKWAKAAPKGFVFAVKGSRFITHVKRLKDCEEPVANFTDRARLLGDALGPILWQLPPNFQRQPETQHRLADFLAQLPQDLRHVVEFRHQSWLTSDVYALLREYNVALCAFHRADWETPLVETTDFAYMRFHGAATNGGSYTDDEIRQWGGRLFDLPEDVREAYIYFNNDAFGHAITNAKALFDFLALLAPNGK